MDGSMQQCVLSVTVKVLYDLAYIYVFIYFYIICILFLLYSNKYSNINVTIKY